MSDDFQDEIRRYKEKYGAAQSGAVREVQQEMPPPRFALNRDELSAQRRSQFERQPVVQPDSEPEFQSELSQRLELQSAPQSQPEQQPELQPESEIQPELEIQPESEPQTEAVLEDPTEILRAASAKLQRDIEQEMRWDAPQDVVQAVLQEARLKARQAPQLQAVTALSEIISVKPETAVYEDVLTHERPLDFFGGLRHDFQYRVRPYFLRDNKKNLKRWIIFAVLILALVVLVSAGAFAGDKLRKLYGGEKVSGNPDLTAVMEEDPDVSTIYEVSDAKDINEMLYTWQTKGDLLSSRNVINILLLGVDSSDGQMSGARADAIMIASLNKKTQKITLVSVMRDCYVYMRVGNSDRYDKLNHAYMWGGPSLLQSTIESLYKIKINNYVCVDFATFPKLIDELGGVQVTVTKRESDYNLKKFQHRLPVGNNVTLDGEQALMFSRIRKLDSDDQRARRQREVIAAIIQKTKSAQVGQLNSAVDTLLKNVRTDLKSGEIISWGTQALTQGWMQYDLTNYTAPSEEHRRDARMTTTSYPSHRLWVWMADFPLSAQELQKLLYGESNIVLAENHQSPFQIMRPAANSGGSGQSGAQANNNNNGAATESRSTGSQVTNNTQPTPPTETQPAESTAEHPPSDGVTTDPPVDSSTEPSTDPQLTDPPTDLPHVGQE